LKYFQPFWRNIYYNCSPYLLDTLLRYFYGKIFVLIWCSNILGLKLKPAMGYHNTNFELVSTFIVLIMLFIDLVFRPFYYDFGSSLQNPGYFLMIILVLIGFEPSRIYMMFFK
jgi:hypothetical protein